LYKPLLVGLSGNCARTGKTVGTGCRRRAESLLERKERFVLLKPVLAASSVSPPKQSSRHAVPNFRMTSAQLNGSLSVAVADRV